MAVIDVFTYNGESEMLELHIKILAPHVDQFYVLEAPVTFSGNRKPLYFLRDKHLVNKYLDKITYYKIEHDDELWKMAEQSPQTQGPEHWKREFMQKESIKKALAYVSDDDYVYIGDVDEIWDPSYKLDYALEKLLMRVYAYYLDNRSNEMFWGTLAGKWRFIKNKVLNHIRNDITYRGTIYAGWHFTSMGGLQEVKRKLDDTYTKESYNTDEVQELLPQRLRAGVDYLGRDFHFREEESEWPKYLKNHRQLFAHLCKGIERKSDHKRGGYV